MAECVECGDDFRLEDGYEDDGMCHQCAHAIAEGQNSRMVSERDLTIRDQRDEIAALRARAERAEAECARMTAEYQAWIEELEGPTPAQLLARAERYREALERIRRWDVLNPPRTDVLADARWLRDLVNAALAATGDEEGKGGEGG